MWIYRCYRWASEASYQAALAAEGWTDGPPLGVDLIVSGTLYRPPADEQTPAVALPGWHVSAAFRDMSPPAAWAARVIEAANGMPVLGLSPVPSQVTNFQARAVLMQTPSSTPSVSLFAAIDGALRAVKDSSPENALAWQAWEQANDFYRHGALVNTLGQQFGLSADQIDALFRAASEVVA